MKTLKKLIGHSENCRSIRSCLRLALATSVIGTGSLSVVAQNSDDEGNLDDVYELDSFVVNGYAESLMKSIDVKKQSVEITDLIVSDDIGKFPDENVAESLQRLTGVQIQRENGEGTYVSIRGVEPNLNLVTIDGRTASSGGFERSFDFSTLSANLVSGLKVIKSQSADLIEGGIGAVIEIHTPKPLDFSEERVGRLTAQTSYSELADDYSPKYSGLYSQQFLDGKAGVLFSFSYEDSLQRTDRFGNNGWVRNAIADGPDLFTPRFFTHELRMQDRLRKGFTGAFQYRADNDMLITLSVNKNDYTTSMARNGFNVNTPNRSAAFPDILDSYTFNENGTAIAFDGQTNQAVPIQLSSNRASESLGFGVDVNWLLNERWTIDFDASYTESETDSNPDSLVDIRFLPSEFPLATYTLPSGGGAPDIALTYSPGIEADSADLYTIRQMNLNRTINENTESAVAVDVDYVLGSKFFSKLEFGARYSDREISRPYMYGFPVIRPAAADRPPVLDELLVDFPVDDFLSGTNASVPRSWLVVDADKTLAYMESMGYAFDVDNPDDYPANPLNLFDINEKVLAAYTKANFSGSLFGLPIAGNVGVRYTKTDLVSSGSQSTNGTTEEVSVDRSYDDILPSFTIIAHPHEDVVVRLAGSRVMTRPNLGYMAVTRTVNLERVPVSINDGNPYLDPYRADQLDLSVEWYPSNSTMLSMAFFYKDVESFVSRLAQTVEFEDSMLPGASILPGEEVLLNRPENLDGDKVKGIEMGIKHIFSHLPAPFDGLGIDANYTYTKSGEAPRNLIFADADLQLDDGSYPEDAFMDLPLEGMSKHSYNISMFYEKDKFSMRMAYNWRDSYLLQSVGLQNTPRMRDEYGQWDGRLAYEINDKFKVTLDAINITEENPYSYYVIEAGRPDSGSNERVSELVSTGRKVILGATYSF